MTVADPHGRFVDTIRTCYASWMNTPDAGRIRVRWYKVAIEPGIYPLTEYSSSDWDEDPKCLDPEFGEESTSRRPFVDWRDCSPPPWGGEDLCPLAKTPTTVSYVADLTGVHTGYANSQISRKWLLSNRLPCEWDNGFSFPPLEQIVAFRVGEDGVVTLNLVEAVVPSTVAIISALYSSIKPAAMDEPFLVFFAGSFADDFGHPDSILITPVRPAVRVTTNNHKRATENGHLRITEDDFP